MRIAAVVALAALCVLAVGDITKGSSGFRKLPRSFPKAINHQYRADGLHGTSVQLRPRDDQDDWDRYVRKGGALMCATRFSDTFAGNTLKDRRNPPSAASIWQGDLREELKKWGWTEWPANEIKDNACLYANTFGDNAVNDYNLERAFQALGLNPYPVSEGGHNECYRIEHWNPPTFEPDEIHCSDLPEDEVKYQVDGKEYRATCAHYNFGMNRVEGAIFSQNVYSPISAAEDVWEGTDEIKVSELPALRSLSDVLWGYWVRNNPNVKNLNYFVVNDVVNNEAIDLMYHALADAKADFSPWPGHTWGTDTEEGRALLASPVGATIAYFLMQHKAQLGIKVVTRVTLVRDELDTPHGQMNMFFRIGDMPVVPDPINPNPNPNPGQNADAEEVVGKLDGGGQGLFGWSAADNNNTSVLRVHKLNDFMMPIVGVAAG